MQKQPAATGVLCAESVARRSVSVAERSRGIQYINRLRIGAIYAVVTAHVAMGLMMPMQPFTADWWLGCWLFFTAHAAIPIFVMISGALLLGNERQESAAQFYKRRFYRVGIPMVVWTAFYLGVRQFIDGEHLTLGSTIRLILQGDAYYHLWFLYMIAGLYLVTPVLRTFVRYASPKERLFVIVAILLLANAYFQADVILWSNRRSILTMFIPFIAYYLCGYEIRRVDPKKVPAALLYLCVIASALYLAAFSEVFFRRQGGVGVRYLFDFFSLPVAFLSIGVFWAAYLHDASAGPPTGLRRTALEWVASTTLGVYVLHPLVLTYLRHQLKNHAGGGSFLAAVIVVPLATFAICYVITSILMNIPVLRRTVC
jgi:surface polysaccharide O-acyltransferase-like enzyme